MSGLARRLVRLLPQHVAVALAHATGMDPLVAAAEARVRRGRRLHLDAPPAADVTAHLFVFLRIERVAAKESLKPAHAASIQGARPVVSGRLLKLESGP